MVNRTILYRWSLFVLTFCTLCFSCERAKIDPPKFDCPEDVTYTDDIKFILDQSCAYAGCHLNAAPGNYDTYKAMESYLLDGKFKKRVVELKDMPPAYAQDGPTMLTEEQLELLNCWIQNDYKE